MVRKRKHASTLTRSPQIFVTSPEDVHGTLPSGVSGCIPEPPLPIPTLPVPIPTASCSDTPLPSGDIPTSSRTAKFKSATPSEVSSDGWQTDSSPLDDSSSEEEFGGCLLGDGPGFTWTPFHHHTRTRLRSNPLLDSLADDFNGLTFGLEDQDDFLNLCLYDSITMLLDPVPPRAQPPGASSSLSSPYNSITSTLPAFKLALKTLLAWITPSNERFFIWTR